MQIAVNLEDTRGVRYNSAEIRDVTGNDRGRRCLVGPGSIMVSIPPDRGGVIQYRAIDERQAGAEPVNQPVTENKMIASTADRAEAEDMAICVSKRLATSGRDGRHARSNGCAVEV